MDTRELTVGEENMLIALIGSHLVSPEEMRVALQASPRSRAAPMSSVYTMLTRLNRRLDKYGLRVRNSPGKGWYFTNADKRKLKQVIEASIEQ